MCGIAVAINWPGAETAVAAIAALQAHRGDTTDPVVSPWPDTALCTRRLRIVDPAHGQQPKLSWDNRILVAMNGEIYNHAALAAELSAQGVTFQTGSDTEVLACALSMWGGRALQRLNGMYAFVALDLRSGEFLAARDPLGVKPLYVVQSGEGFLFASEIRPLLEATGEGQVMLLPPGHLLTRTRVAQFTSFMTDRPAEDAIHDPHVLDTLLADAVAIRVPEGLEVATMMSGGIDSTLIAHYLRRLRPDAPGYFLGGPKAPDFRYAADYAAMNDYDLRIVSTDYDGRTIDRIDAVVAAMESFEPNVVRGGLCTYLLSERMHRDGFRVGLCGEGADELFAGYSDLENAYAAAPESGEFVREQCLGLMNKTALQRVDRGSMRFQLELREPFLDPSVARYAFSLSGDQLWSRNADGRVMGKQPLRSLYDLHPDQLPTSIRDRNKSPLNEGSGFDESNDVSPWSAFAEEVITDKAFAEGQRRYAGFTLRNKEEFLFLDRLKRTIDVDRVPHLMDRALVRIPLLAA